MGELLPSPATRGANYPQQEVQITRGTGCWTSASTTATTSGRAPRPNTSALFTSTNIICPTHRKKSYPQNARVCVWQCPTDLQEEIVFKTGARFQLQEKRKWKMVRTYVCLQLNNYCFRRENGSLLIAVRNIIYQFYTIHPLGRVASSWMDDQTLPCDRSLTLSFINKLRGGRRNDLHLRGK